MNGFYGRKPVVGDVYTLNSQDRFIPVPAPEPLPDHDFTDKQVEIYQWLVGAYRDRQTPLSLADVTTQFGEYFYSRVQGRSLLTLKGFPVEHLIHFGLVEMVPAGGDA